MKILFGREAPFKDIGVECRIALLYSHDRLRRVAIVYSS